MPPARSAVPTLTDGAVTLRAHHDGDIGGVVEQCHDPATLRWTTVPLSYSRDDAARYIRDYLPGSWHADQEWGFAVEHDGRFAGTVSLRNEGDGRAEIAFGAHPAARGTGAMEGACRLLLAWGFAERDLHTVIWYAYPGNWASRRLAWKVGFSFDGTLRSWLRQRGEPRDAWAGTLLAGEPMHPRQPWLVPPVIELGDLRLRPQTETDEPRVLQTCADPESRRWWRLEEPATAELVRAEALRAGMEMAEGRTLRWAVAEAETDRFLGVVNLFGMSPDAPGNAELGFFTHPDARGRGVATAAARAAVRHGLLPVADGGLGLARVFAIAGVENHASRRALLAAGLTESGVQRGRLPIDGVRMDAAYYDVLAGELFADESRPAG